MNTMYILLDGAEDNNVKQLGGRKPLDAAHMPFFRSAGRYTGTTSGRGYTHLFLNEFFSGDPPCAARAVIEALGLGMNMDGGRTAYRMSPARINNGMIEWIYDLDRISSIIEKTALDNMHILDGMDPEIDFFLNGRAIITMMCDDLPDLPSPPDPVPFVEVPGILGEFVDAVAKELDGVTLYPWGCGRLPAITSHSYIKNMTAISNTPTALGVCRSLGHEIKRITDIEERVSFAAEELQRNDVFLHIDEIDEYSHQKDPQKKVNVLEFADKMFGRYLSEDDRIVFFIDHGTSSVTGNHIIMDVPFWTSFETSVMDNEHVELKELIPKITDKKR